MEEKIKEIEDLPLPVCMYRSYKHLRFWFTIIPILIATVIGFIYIVKCQDAQYRWETFKFRIQFSDPLLEPFNGCYHNDFLYSTDIFKRDFYLSDSLNEESAKFGFCIDTKQWILYQGNSTDPCNADTLIHSARTDHYDISTSFFDDWFTNEHIPADLYFFDDDYRGDNLHCEQFLNNGVCDAALNTAFHNFDNGDCCASTCTLPNCEVGGVENAFGSTNTSGDGYADCINPDMVPLTIYLHGFVSSHDPDVVTLTDEDREQIEAFMPDYYTETPSDTLLLLYCNDVKILKYYINKSMENQTETVMVENGASCEIRIENSTSSVPKWEDAALWYMNYTVYQGAESDSVESPILAHKSSQEEGQTFFDLIPNCYLGLLSTHIENNIVVDKRAGTGNIQGRSVRWILKSVVADCLNLHSVLARYVLSVLNFAAPASSIDDGLWIESETPDLCGWKHVVCNQNLELKELDLLYLDIDNLNLTGYIPTEVGLLSTLVRYDACKFDF